MRTLVARIAMLAILLSSPFVLKAQDNAAMTGIVTDSTGAVIPGTKVVLLNPARGIDAFAKTDKDGSYRFPNVPPAPGYKVTFSHDGFASVEVNDIALLVGSTRTQNARLIAGASTTVEVSAAANQATLNTTDASVGNNFDIELLNELPVQNRNSPRALFTLQPGINSVGAVTGARTDQTSFTIDGMDVNDFSTGSYGTIVGNAPVDAIQEFKGTVAGLPSNLGTGSGGQFQLVTRSGTNKFHGNLNEYHRDTSTASNLWFNNISSTPRTPLIRNQFGGAIGGPVLHDKLFFFADFYNSRIIQSQAITRTVPLDSYRNGNLSYVNNNTGCLSTSRQTTTPNCISQLTPAQLVAADPAGIGFSSTIISLIGSRYPHANDLTLGDGVNTGGYRFTMPTPDLEYDGVARIDYNLSSKQRVFIKFNAVHRDAIQSLNRFASDPVTRPFQDRSYGFVGSHTWELGSNKVNQFYYGDNIQVASFPLTYNPNGTTYVSGFGPFTAPYDGGNIQRRRIPVPAIRDEFSWQKGTHNLGFGGSFKWVKTSNLIVNDYNFYTLGLGGVTTALNASLRPTNISANATNTAAFDSAFALGLGRVGAIASNYNFNAAGQVLPSATGSVRRYRYYQTELYAGDTWKVNKELTLTYGIRYQIYSVPVDTLGAEATPNIGFDAYFKARVAQSASASFTNSSVPFIQYNLAGSVNNAPGFFQPNWHDFAPRFSFAYNPSYSPKTVINGAINLVYDRTIYNAINFIQNQSSFIFQNSVTVNYGQTDPALALKNDPRVGSTLTTLPPPAVAPAITKPYTPYVNSAGVPTGLNSGSSNIAVDPNLKTPYSIAINLGMQQELPGKMVMKLSYVGRMGRRLLAQADASQLIDFTDPVSGQTLSQGFAQLEAFVRPNLATASTFKTTTPAVPFFENQITSGAGGYANKTAILAYNQSGLINSGDITDALRYLVQISRLNPNVGLASQFAENDYYTNKGSSAYNGMLLTVSKNMSQGVKFDFNYTLSHSIDNVSVVANTVANGTGFICDVLHMRACRGNSDFDTTHVISSDVVMQLPFGKGRTFAAKAPWYVDEAIGGWTVSVIPFWQSGQAYTTSTGAFIAGYASNAPAIFDGSKSNDVATHLHKNSLGQLFEFDDQAKALSHFRAPNGIEYGSRNNLRGPSQFYMDAGLSKNFQILPDNRLRAVFRADAYNVLNHPTFGAPTASIFSTAFGQTSTQTSPIGGQGYRVGQFSLRLEF